MATTPRSDAAREVDNLNRSLSSAATEAARLARTTRKLEQSMEDASNGAIDKAAEALEALAKQSSILEDSVKDNIKANKQAPRELAKVMDRLEKQGDLLIAAQKKYRDALKSIQASQAAAQRAANGNQVAERKAKADALRAERAATRALKEQLTSLGLSAQNAAGKIDALAAEAKANKATIQKVASDLSKPSAKLSKGLDVMHSKVQSSISRLGEFSVVVGLAKKAISELYGQSIRLANKGLVGSMAQMNISALKLRMTAEEFEGLVSANRDMIALMGGGAQGISNFEAVLNESSAGLEYLGKEGKKAAATIMTGFNRAGFGIMSSNDEISKAYQDNVKGLNKQFKMFSGIFGDTAEQFAALYEQQLKSEALQAKMLSGDTKGYALQLKEMMVRTETLKLMGLNNEQIVAMSRRVDSLFNPRENRQGASMSERMSARSALAFGADTIAGEDSELAAKISGFVQSGEMERVQQMSAEDKRNYMVKNAELFKGIAKMEQMIAAQRDRDGGDTSTIGLGFTDRAKAAGGEYSWMAGSGKDMLSAQAQGYDQTEAGRLKLAAKGFENVMSDVTGETTALGVAFGKLRDVVETVTSLMSNPFTTAITAFTGGMMLASSTLRTAVASAATGILKSATTLTAGVGGLVKMVFGGIIRWLVAFGLDKLLGLGGVGGNSIDEKQDDANWGKMTAFEKLQSGTGRGIESIGPFFGLENVTNQARSQRITSESAYLKSQNRGTNATLPSGSPSMPSASTMPNAAKPPATSGSTMPYDFNKYAAALGKRESGNNYGIVNTLGYSGKYQFGASALADLGYVKRGTTNRGLTNPANWNIPGGLDGFLSNPKMQEEAFKKYTDMHYQQLLKAGVITPTSSADEVAGYLATAHLKGIGGAIDLKKGKNGTDAYGTTASSYFSLGSMTQAPGAQLTTPTVAATATAPSQGSSTTSTQTAAAAPASTSAQPTSSMQASATNTANPVINELQKHTSLLNVMVTLLGKTEASKRGYQMDQQTGLSVAT